MKKILALVLLSVGILAGECQDALFQVIYNKDQYLIGDSTEYAKRVIKYTKIAEKVCSKEDAKSLKGVKERYQAYIKEDKRLGIRQHPVGYILGNSTKKERK